MVIHPTLFDEYYYCLLRERLGVHVDHCLLRLGFFAQLKHESVMKLTPKKLHHICQVKELNEDVLFNAFVESEAITQIDGDQYEVTFFIEHNTDRRSETSASNGKKSKGRPSKELVDKLTRLANEKYISGDITKEDQKKYLDSHGVDAIKASIEELENMDSIPF